MLKFHRTTCISNFRLGRLPKTNTKRDVLNASKTSYQLYIEEFINEFSDEKGFNCSTAFDNFKSFCSSNGFVSCASNKLGVNISRYVDRKRVRADGKLEWRYFIKPDFKIEDDNVDIIDLDATADVHI